MKQTPIVVEFRATYIVERKEDSKIWSRCHPDNGMDRQITEGWA